MGPAVLAQKVETTKEGVKVIRQGGYVEKFDPHRDFKNRLPRIPPRTPAESVKAFHIIPGFRIEQVAAEPLVRDPVDLDFDENGRLFVAEMTTYSEARDSRIGRVSMLEDTDGDGRFDKSTVYVDSLAWPTAVMCYDGGVFVASSPDLLYCKDTDGDGVADRQEVILTGFDTSNPNAVPNSLRWGLDNRIHGMASTSGGKLRSLLWERTSGQTSKPIESRGRDFSFDPRSGELRLESGGSQFGMTYDDWGRKFESANTAPIEMVMYEDRYIARNPYLTAPRARVAIHVYDETLGGAGAVYRTSPIEPWRIIRTEMRISGSFSGPVEGGGRPAGYFTAACGVTIYTGNAWPQAFHGNAFVCEGAGNLVHRMRLDPSGVGFTAHRTEKKKEFLTSDEIWFRPIQFTNGPDGTLYLADMYREIFEHPDAIPPSAKKYLDTSAGNDRGRIYRFLPEGFKQQPPPRLGKMTIAELVGLLQHPNRWQRVTAARLLCQRGSAAAVEPLRRLAVESKSPLGRMHAMYVLHGLKALDPEAVLAGLGDDHPRVREHAVRLAEAVLAESPAVRDRLYQMVSDDDPRVRYQLAFTLGEISGARATAALAAIARRDGSDKWIRLAVLSSCFGRAGELLALLAEDADWRATPAGRGLLEELARQAGLQKHDDQVAEVFGLLESLGDSQKDLAQAIVRGLSKGLAASGSPLLARLSSGGGRAGKLLEEMISRAVATAADAQRPVAARVTAVRSLAMASFDKAGGVLGQLLDSRQPQEVQMAALAALSRFHHEQVAEMIIEAWGGFSPQVRGEAAEALFARPKRIAALLDAIAEGTILPGQLDPARIVFLRSHPDAAIRARAEELLADVHLGRREDVVKAYHDVLARKGDAGKGREIFKRECSKCHRLEGVGNDLGLPLATVRNKGPEAILMSVLDPNRDVLPQYLNYVIVTDDGLSVTGMITSETATSITLKRAENKSDTVLRANIDEMVNTGISIMPEGLEEQVSKEEMADLIAYLMSLE